MENKVITSGTELGGARKESLLGGPLTGAVLSRGGRVSRMQWPLKATSLRAHALGELQVVASEIAVNKAAVRGGAGKSKQSFKLLMGGCCGEGSGVIRPVPGS